MTKTDDTFIAALKEAAAGFKVVKRGGNTIIDLGEEKWLVLTYRGNTEQGGSLKLFIDGIDQYQTSRIDGGSRTIMYTKDAIQKAIGTPGYESAPKSIRTSTGLSVDLDGDIETIIGNLQRYSREYTQEGWKNLGIEMECEAYSNSEQRYPYLFGERIETAAETNKRVSQETARREQTEARDRTEYERLQKKFG